MHSSTLDSSELLAKASQAAPRRQIIFEHLQLAQSLGANTAVLAGNDIALTIADYAREQNISKIVFGRSHQRWLWPWTSFTQQLTKLAPEPGAHSKW